ncbi:PLDc N-terminal domain-containing protein [Microbacteriaceae bacterium 4G12]
MANLLHSLPFLIPIIIIEIGLTIAALVHIFTHKKYRVGNRVLWVILSFVQIIGPVLYFIIGRSDEE